MQCDKCHRPALIRQGVTVLCALCYATKERDACLCELGSKALPKRVAMEYTRKAGELNQLIRALKRPKAA